LPDNRGFVLPDHSTPPVCHCIEAIPPANAIISTAMTMASFARSRYQSTNSLGSFRELPVPNEARWLCSVAAAGLGPAE
jgi:hypothetical protein